MITSKYFEIYASFPSKSKNIIDSNKKTNNPISQYYQQNPSIQIFSVSSLTCNFTIFNKQNISSFIISQLLINKFKLELGFSNIIREKEFARYMLIEAKQPFSSLKSSQYLLFPRQLEQKAKSALVQWVDLIKQSAVKMQFFFHFRFDTNVLFCFFPSNFTLLFQLILYQNLVLLYYYWFIILNLEIQFRIMIKSTIKTWKLSFILLFNMRSPISLTKMQPFAIQNYEIGQRLDRFIKKSPIGWTSGQKYLRQKDILIQKTNGDLVNNSNYRLEQGDILYISHILKQRFGKTELSQDRSVPLDQAAKTLDKMLLFDNQNIAVLNKLCGYSVQGGPEPKFNIFSLMSSKYKKQLIHITHRLDKCTSGIVLIAKNKETAQIVQSAMEEKQGLGKFYLTITEGKQKIQRQGFIRSNIEWTKKNKARICNQAQENSKDCITFYTPIPYEVSLPKLKELKLGTKREQKQRVIQNLLGVKLLTGRKHQIRCHLGSYLEQKILNDKLYGGRSILGDQQSIFLHACGLKIENKQLLQKILKENKTFINKKLGEVLTTQKGILFIGNLPSFWQEYLSNQKEQIEMEKLVNQIEDNYNSTIQVRPKKRNLTTII